VSGHSNARTLRVVVAPDPQLSVCKGLVENRVREIDSPGSGPVLDWRCARASYGTLCKVLYNKNDPNHVGARVELDPMNNKKYVVQVVE